ncbi:DUF1810 family protein [Sinorhizobium medicae]|uniref:DUF1810 family protein n=2 Tax=Sinorhizobium medicae TaxID=110321 RepID=A6U5M0_SINMW|nr:DUF1810 domain-containing protein [Sinorhizobium medicae]ABR58950.1 Protein of unknown function DUF1810 [Sinorhizobium medicae WSM419]MDX0407155.1 DUF1810 family protein [Sinorhizobium medicae]MDX0412700.1 DUF1810 family protein [Sinorhizobium medicae]MDX0419184.1 DUF1810 family protein [Sinorhizobium medicae]MDX0430253.1 DUF1810 family protein [Sinorhizobium medicae]
MAGAAFDLERFTAAQEGSYPAALAELRAGAKHTHWMWFIFPQIAGLGRSPTAIYYALPGLPEARAYFGHPLLGRRILECTEAVNGVRGRSALEIFGRPDDFKFRSSMTLFEAAAPEADAFARALDFYFNGVRDPKTLEILGRS